VIVPPSIPQLAFFYKLFSRDFAPQLFDLSLKFDPGIAQAANL
jgi:hypothetical protein